MNWIFARTSLLEQGLNASWKRNKIIAENIANIDTPGFKASRVEFESILADALEGMVIQGKKTRKGHMDIGPGSISSIQPVVRQDTKTTMRMDGNNVDIDREMVELAENIIRFNAQAQLISKELGRIRTAVQEGRR